MPKRAVFERSRRGFSLYVSVGLHILLVVEQSSLESQSRECAKTPILTVLFPVFGFGNRSDCTPGFCQLPPTLTLTPRSTATSGKLINKLL